MLDRLLVGFQPLAFAADAEQVTIVLLLAPAAFLSEDVTSIGAGLLVANGSIPYIAAVVSCYAGILSANLALYGLGRVLGLAVFDRAPMKWICSRHDIERHARWFNRNGARVIFITRCIPGTRLPTCVAAGMLKMPLPAYTLYQAGALLLWTPSLVGAASLAGEGILPLLTGFRRYALPAVLLLGLLAVAIIKILIPMIGQRGRRLVRARWTRLTGWMFWPRILFHAPLVLYAAGLRLRHRAWTCTVCNPAVPASGLAGESKADVLDHLHAHGLPVVEGIRLARDRAASARIEAAERFMREHGLHYPVVLKPDRGHHGRGVRIVRSAGSLHRALTPNRPVDMILQAFVPGAEFDACLARHPASDRVDILSIARLAPLIVTGDGARTLDDLILGDPAAACRYRLLARRFRGRLRDVPAAGQRMVLTELGSFRHGARFEDARTALDPTVASALQRLLRDVPGIHLGRFNIRLCEDSAWRSGFRIIEFNGLSAVPSHLYELGTGPLRAWRTLARQWRLAFEIGAWHVAAGVNTWPLRDVCKLYAASRDFSMKPILSRMTLSQAADGGRRRGRGGDR